jgi:hypothetical protein
MLKMNNEPVKPGTQSLNGKSEGSKFVIEWLSLTTDRSSILARPVLREGAFIRQSSFIIFFFLPLSRRIFPNRLRCSPFIGCPVYEGR